MQLLLTLTHTSRRAAAAVVLLAAVLAFAAVGAGSAAASPGAEGTTTVVTVSPSAIGPGDSVTLTALVTGTGGNPTGTVVFAANTSSGSTNVDSPATLTPVAGSTTTSQASLTTTSFAAGAYSITATYRSNDLTDYFGSTSTGVPLTVSSVVIHNTTTTLAAAPTTLTAGQAVTLTAAVAESDGGTIIPTGDVTFTEGGVLLGTATLDATGATHLIVTSFLSGTHVITASYIGDIVDRSSSATLTLVVGPGASGAVQTTTTVQVTPNRIVAGQSVTISAHVIQTGAGTTPPGGPLVTFTANGVLVGQAPLDASGNATVTVPGWVGGTYDVQASYVGDINDRASSGNTQLSVNALVTPLTISSPSVSFAYGSAVPALGAIYSGLLAGDTAASLTAPATCTTTATSTSPAGTYPVTCSGAVSALYAITYVNTGTVTVTRSPLTVTGTSATITAGQAIPALTATITGFTNGQTLATSGVAGSASCTTTATASSPAGTYPITCTLGTLTAANYSFTFVAGSLTIAPATSSCTTARKIGDGGSHRGAACEVLLYAYGSGDCSTNNSAHAGDTQSALYADETPLAGGSAAPTATINGQSVAVTVTPIVGRYIALLTFTLPSTLAPGTYTVLLSAHDSDGHADLVSWQVTVTRSSGSHH